MKTKPARERKWFGVKTLYRVVARGRPATTDAGYDPGVTLVEERVIVLRASSFGDAIRAAEREARVYARGEYTNPYGQRVAMRYLGECDAFEMFASPRDGGEVYSRTQLVDRGIRDRRVGDELLGVTETRRARATRKKFFNGEL